MLRFQNLNPEHQPQNLASVFRWAVWDRLRGKRHIRHPGPPAPAVAANLKQLSQLSGPPQATWIGHSSYLLSIAGEAVLIDPVFAEKVGYSYARHGKPGLLPEQLPPVRAILISHNHYDHLNLASLRAIEPQATLIAPQGMKGYLRKRCPHAAIVELDWWQSTRMGPLEITFVPARHWSSRLLVGRNRSRWGGYIIQGNGYTVYHAGDSAWFEGFAEIAARFPKIDAAFMPIGAYEPLWFMQNHHMTPEQSGDAFLAVQAQRMIPMHYGTFQMTDEPLMEPLERLQDWWADQAPPQKELITPKIGETFALT